MLKSQETILEIDLSALKHNVTFIKSKLKSSTKFLAVVKAYAYGSDAVEIAKYLEDLNVDYFAVAYTNEAISLRDAGIKTPILVLHPQPEKFKLIIERCLEPSIYSQRVLNEFITVAEKQKQYNYPIHIKFNTGLNRLGFAEAEAETILNSLKTTEAIKVKSLFSHLAASEDVNEKDFTLNQIKSFKRIAKKMIDNLGYQPLLHQSNTSGVLNYPEAHFDMVRCGIGLYGFGNNPEINKNLKPVGTLKTSISQIHTIKKGDSLGYNRAFIANEDIKTATLPIGHADGINRLFGNGKGFVFINNQKAFIIGNVCMDMIMVDVTTISCKEGDEVIVFGPQHSAESLAESINSISYELLTSVSQRIKRVFYR
ncbi:alanine racemase [Lacinutrix sp. Bg11-31]|uniref:alanine racemase n=1 Tax=Lacinutrix sp. Bg11-31 TaxID=2057808 RepID=UPI000C3143D7|nr:alanine racemase [Lacinutrix sp. Bg11-31]AUC83041.1 alanine racemase [Lacinutrix sp. Bg11-31]